MEDTFTPSHTQKHTEPAGLESFRFSASYFSCRAIHSYKGGFKPRDVLGRQLQAVVRALPWLPAHGAAPSRTARRQRAHLRPPSDVLNSICQPLYFSIIGTFCFCITEYSDQFGTKAGGKDKPLGRSSCLSPESLDGFGCLPWRPKLCQVLHLQEDPSVWHQDSAPLLVVTWLGPVLSTLWTLHPGHSHLEPHGATWVPHHTLAASTALPSPPVTFSGKPHPS